MTTFHQRSVATTLSDRALLVSLQIRMWSARKLDRRETAALAVRHGINKGVARVHKTLLPSAPKLDELQTCSSSIRNFYYENTLPWAVDGSQMLPATRYMDFAQEARERMDAWHRIKDAFVQEYPAYRQAAARALNGLFRDDDYPHPDVVAEKFSVDVRFFPMPDARDFRVTLADGEMERIAEELEETARQALAGSTRECWSRLHGVVSRAVERLSQPDAIFRDSLVENAKELCGLLTDLNLGDDPELERMRQLVERTLASQNPDTLRQVPAVRQEVADKLAEMERKMKAFMG